jgi:GT2 family glycosyltransferase
MSDHGCVLNLLVAVCTKDRPDELAGCLLAIANADPSVPIVVVDASSGQESIDVCDQLRKSRLPGLTRLSVAPGLAAQRNLSLALALERGHDVVVFVDDDVRVEPDFLCSLMDEMAARPDVGAAGGVVIDEPAVRAVAVKAFFRLWSRRPGVVLPSGRNVIGHAPQGPWPRDVQWLSTCAVALRLSAVGSLRFDERLAGYSYGEDLDLTFRLSRRAPLTVAQGARVRHRQAQLGRPVPRALARRRIQLLHAWVRERRQDGLRLGWFWWSVLGEALILGGRGVVDGAARSEAMGVVEGAVAVLRHGSSREVPDG